MDFSVKQPKSMNILARINASNIPLFVYNI